VPAKRNGSCATSATWHRTLLGEDLVEVLERGRCLLEVAHLHRQLWERSERLAQVLSSSAVWVLSVFEMVGMVVSPVL
jgi:hypothetical protein